MNTTCCNETDSLIPIKGKRMVPLYLLQRHHSLQKANEVGGTKDVVRRGSIRHNQIPRLTLSK